MSHEFKIGDKVIYKGLIGRVEELTESAAGRLPMLSLISESDPELSCSAMESECELYDGQEVDEGRSLLEAQLSSARIKNIAENLTDKYFRDGNH